MHGHPGGADDLESSRERLYPDEEPPELRVSVVVPVMDGAGVIEGCLKALDAQTLESCEVIVVDDGSRDDTRARAEAFAARARIRMRVIAMPANQGPAAARNAGIAAARASVIAFTDADCEPAPDWLERATARLRADSRTVAVEGRIEPRGEPGALTHQMRNVTGGQYMTANMVYRREAIQSAGGFDERFRLAYLEDTDLALSVLDAGGEIAWEPDAVVFHLVLPEGRRKFWRDARKHFFNPLVYAKHPALYVQRLRPFRPAFPRLYLRFMFSVLVVAASAVAAATSGWVWGLAGVGFLAPLARGWWRIAYVHRARDPVSILQAGLYPFVQTAWVLAGCLRFRAFSPRL